METDHLDREARFSRSRPPSLRNLALAAAALLLVTGARPAPQQNDHDRAFGPRPTANATRPVAPDPIDAQRDFKPTLVDCAKLKPKKPRPPAVLTDDNLRMDLHDRILWDIRDFDGGRSAAKWAFYVLTAVAILLGTIAAFLIAVDFQHQKGNGQSKPRPRRKWVVVGCQIGATMVTGAAATFKLADMWYNRVDGVYQLRNLDSELVVGGCTTDEFGHIFRQVNLIEAEEYDLKGIFSPTTSQKTSTEKPGEAPPLDTQSDADQSETAQSQAAAPDNRS